MEGNSNAQDDAGIRRRIQKDMNMFEGSIAEASAIEAGAIEAGADKRRSHISRFCGKRRACAHRKDCSQFHHDCRLYNTVR